MKKYLYILIITALVLMTFSALAANAADLTVTHASVGETYSAYKLFDVTNSGEAYAYYHTFSKEYASVNATDKTIDGAVKALATANPAYIELAQIGSTNKYIVKKTANFTDVSIASFLRNRYSNGDFPASTITATAEGTTTTAETRTEGSATLTLTDPGYYFVTTTQGTVVSTDTFVNSALSIEDKNGDPTITKKVKSGSSTGFNFNNQVTYQMELKITPHLKNLVFWEMFPAGVTWTGAVGVYTSYTSGSQNDRLTNTNPKKYDLVQSNLPDGVTFKIVFMQEYLDSITEDTTLIIICNGTLNENAAIGIGENTNLNRAKITWGNNQYDEATANVNTGRIVFTKTGTNSAPLAGVKFRVYQISNNTKQYLNFEHFTNSVAESDYPGTLPYRLDDTTSTTTDASQATVLETDAYGRIILKLLKKEKYYFEEIETKPGYQLATAPKDVQITTAGATVTATMTNETGTRLPSTGGVGSKIFITVGLLTMLATGVILAANRLMKKEDLYY